MNRNKIDYQNLEHQLPKLLWFLLIIIGVITFYPLCLTGFVNCDDYVFFLNSTPSHWLEGGKIYSEAQGRFFYILIMWVNAIPYLIDSQLYYAFTHLFPIVLSFILFVIFTNKIFHNTRWAILCGILLCATLPINGHYSAVSGYPFNFSLSICFILSSLLLLLHYFKKRRYSLLLLSALTMGIATLFYEIILFYYIIVLILLLTWNFDTSLNPATGRWKRLFKLLSPYIFFGLLYIITYIIYYVAHPSVYDGTTINTGFSLSQTCRTLKEMSFFSLPLSSFYDYSSFLYTHSGRGADGWLSWRINTLFNAGLVAWIKGAIVLFIAALTVHHANFKFSYKKLIIIFCTAAIFIFFPNIPLALSSKYSSNVPTAYVTTLYAFFAFTFMALSLFIIIQQLLKNKPFIRYTLNAILGIILFVITILVQYTNEQVANDLSVSQNRFKLMETLIDNQYINANETVYLERILSSPSYFGKDIVNHTSSLSSHIYLKNHFNIKQQLQYEELYNQFKESDEIVNLIYYSQAAKSQDCFMAIGRCKGRDLSDSVQNNRFDSLLIVYYSSYKQFSLSIISDSLSKLFINGKEAINSNHFHYANINALNMPKMVDLKIKANQLNPNTLMISNILYPQLIPMTLNDYNEEFMESEILYYMNRIRHSKSQMKEIERKAKEQGISIEESLTNDAKWLMYHENDNNY